MSVRQLVRRLVPLATRQALAQLRRRLNDDRQGLQLTARRGAATPANWHLLAEIRQPVMPSALFENKLANLRLGASKVHLALIEPRQMWSFWRYVGQPVERNGFVVGRNLVAGQLTRQVGGGLCQLSSMLYHLGLCSGLIVAERHAHSIDIYQEHERFTPLGADATVVWGYKDLRMLNLHPHALLLECEIDGHMLIGRSWASTALPRYEVRFEREPIDKSHVLVHTLVNGLPHTQTRYEQQQGMGLQAEN